MTTLVTDDPTSSGPACEEDFAPLEQAISCDATPSERATVGGFTPPEGATSCEALAGQAEGAARSWGRGGGAPALDNGPAGVLETIDLALRDAPGLLDRIDDGEDLAGVARAMIVTIGAGGAAFGACLGVFRGGWQVLFAAVKLPLAVLLTAAICAPALTALNKALDREASIRRDLALVLFVLARASLVLAAVAPILLLAVSLEAAYHTLVLLAAGCGALAGISALSILKRGLARSGTGASAVSVGMALVLVFSLVGAQMSWMLRPYLVRPRSPEAPFVRDLESNFFEAVATSARSARGVYRRPYAPLPEESDLSRSAP